ncbi:MAG: toxin [Candidatus Riflebacteria bacterium]|nr:toxin [Candidatus Riflebacteria bacterium]
MEFFEAPWFTEDLGDYLTDDEYRQLQAFLVVNPRAGDVIRGTGGLRKIRWSQEARGKGKRGGVRVIYFLALADRILMIAVYDKDTQDDLSLRDRKTFKAYIELALLGLRASRKGSR